MADLDDPERNVVKPDVIDVIYRTMCLFGRPDKDYSKDDLSDDESINLSTNLRITLKVRRAMGTPYTRISRDKHKGKGVTQDESKDAVTVEMAIDLVHGKANDKD